MKSKREKPTYKGIEFDSVGEMHFYWWCEELIEAGYMEKVDFHPDPLILSNPVKAFYKKPMKKTEDKILEKTLLNGHEYTADFLCIWDEKAFGKFIHNRYPVAVKKEDLELLITSSSYPVTWIETKPAFDQNNMTRLAVINQKWVMKDHGIFINIVIPEKLFAKTFTPKRYLTCDKSPKERKITYKGVRTLEEFLKEKEI